MSKEECILCMINAGKVPAKKVYEDEEVLAVLDVNGAAPGHAFVFPKEHYPILEQLPNSLLTKIFLLSNKLSSALFDTLNIQGTNLFVQNGVAAGQRVAHFMIQVIPRNENDNVDLQWKPRQLSEEEMSTVELKMKEQTQNLLVTDEKSQSQSQSKSTSQQNEVEEDSGSVEDDFRLKHIKRIPR